MPMKVSTCSLRPVLIPCSLNNFDYQVDPYLGCGHYCYYCYALNQAESDWTREILIHEDITGQLRDELSKISPQTIYLGYNTDPYQPCEAEYRQTRKVLELFVETVFCASVLTKSDLVVRDLDIYQAMDHAGVSVSVAFNDDHIRKQFEANTIDTQARIEALRKMREAGVKTGALICPVIPYITDVIPLVDLLAPITDTIWIYGLSMQERSERNWQNVQSIFNEHHFDLREEIETVIFSKEHPYWTRLRHELTELKQDRKLNLNIHV